jgi:ABC-type proline/glycine betaine transport system ATPase subunit
MNWHLLLTDNVDQIDMDPDQLVEKCAQYFGREFAVYRPLPFVDHTGFTETVAEEIEFVIEAQKTTEGAYLDVANFIKAWGLEPWANQRVVHLSGGWRKFLGVALFANCRTPAKCFLDVVSHLADERIKVLLRQLKAQSEDVVVFCEYDSHLVFDLSAQDFSLLLENEEGLHSLSHFPVQSGVRLHSNYERS